MNNISGNNPSFDLFRADDVNLSDLKVGKDGRLKKMSLVDRVKQIFASKDENQETRTALIKNLKDYIATLEKENKPEDIKKIFGKIAKLRDAQFIFDLKENGVITKKVENTLRKEIETLRAEKEQLRDGKVESGRTFEEVKLAIRIEKAKLANKLGVDFKANKGATGTALIQNLRGKYIGVFKPIHEHTPLKAKLLNNIKRIFGGQLSYLSFKTDAQAKAEVAAYRLDRHFGFGLSPESEFLRLDGKEGTFQNFLKEFTEAAQLLEASERTESISLPGAGYSFDLNQFQKMTIFDYLIGNLDRHEENWGIAHIKTEKGVEEALKVIDNANAFLCKNPDTEGKVKNQYKWKTLNLAESPFTPEMIDFVQSQLTDSNLDSFIADINKKFPDFLNADMTAALRQRLHVIQNIVKEGKTPAQLGNIISDADMFLHS